VKGCCGRGLGSSRAELAAGSGMAAIAPEVVTTAAFEAIDYGRLLLESTEWGPPVARTPSRTIHRRSAPEPYCQGQWIRGRIKGESDVRVLLHLLCDHKFKQHIDRDIRDLQMTQDVVQGQLWVQREVIDLKTPLVANREVTYLTAQAELGGGQRLLVEAPLSGDQPPDSAGTVRARRFVACRLAPVGDDEIELTVVTEVHLGGNVTAHFQESHLDARCEIVDAINAYVASPAWHETREQLARSGPVLIRRLSPLPSAVRAPGAPNSGKGQRWKAEAKAEATAEARADADAKVTPEPTQRNVEAMLHLAQVHTFANLNSGREATDMAFIEGLIQSRQQRQPLASPAAEQQRLSSPVSSDPDSAQYVAR